MRLLVLGLALVAALALLPAPAHAAVPFVHVSSLGVPVTTYVTHGTYTITAYGTYQYSPYAEDIADADYSWHWRDGACIDVDDDNHDLLVNGASPWTAPCTLGEHTYTTTFVCSDLVCPLTFQIKDDNAWDNSGYLYVEVRGGRL